MTISVVLPAYNEEKYIRRCIESILDQTITPDEILIVDNNSKDKTIEYASLYPITILHQPVQGIVPARNLGFDTAKSDIIARTDADTRVAPTWLAQILDKISREGCDAILGASYYSGSSRAINAALFSGFVKTVKNVFHTYPLIGPNMAVRRSSWQKIRKELCANEKEMHEDIDIALHLRQNGGNVCYDPTNIAWTSARRLVQKPHSFFLEYPHRLYRMKQTHG